MTRLQRTGLENQELLYLQLKGPKGALGCILFKVFSFPADNNRIVNNRRTCENTFALKKGKINSSGDELRLPCAFKLKV